MRHMISKTFATGVLAVFISISMATLACAETAMYTKEGYLVSRSKKNLAMALNFEKSRNKQALEEMIKKKKVYRFEKGKKIFVDGNDTVEIGDSAEVVFLIRYEGEVREFWTTEDAVEK